MNEFQALRKEQAVAAIGDAIVAANAAGDSALAGRLATAFYWAVNVR
jgi:hypothetical protein